MSMQAPFMIPSMGMMAPFGVVNKMALAPALYIGDLDESIQEEFLYDFFSKFGAIHFVRIMRDTTTGKSRGYGFVNFINPRDAENAKQYAQYEKLGKKQIRIMFKRPIKELTPEANLYVKQIDPSVTVRELHNHFANHGNVVCAKIATDSEGRSLGYGYVQFEKPEDAENALKILQGSKLKEKELVLSKFVPKDKRETPSAKTNIYLKDLPHLSTVDEVQKLITKTVVSIVGKEDKIKSIFVKKHPKEDKYCAFVCLSDPESADKVYKTIEQNPYILDKNQKVYINWHQNKTERERELKRQHAQVQNQNNLFVKNLRLDITEDDLKKAFQNFGKVTSVAVKEWTSNGGQKSAKFGYIAFDNADDAKRALTEGLKLNEIRSLYIPTASPYINLHQSKDRRTEYLQSIRRKKMQAMMNPMDMYRAGMGFPPGPVPNRRFQQPYPPLMYNQIGARPVRPGGPKTGGQGKPNWNKAQPAGQRPNAANKMPGMAGPAGAKSNFPGPNANAPANVRPNPTAGAKTQPVQQKPPQPQPVTVQSLKAKLNEFLALEEEKQRQILGELLFPLVKAKAPEQYAPKITGMLIDLSVLEVTEILEFLEDPELLQERINEAIDLLRQSEN